MEKENKTEKSKSTKKKVVPKKTQQARKKSTSAKSEPKVKITEEEIIGDKTKSTEKDFWSDTKENITEGARILSEEAKHLGKKIASYSELLFGKIKDNTSEVFKYGLDLTNEGVHKAQEMAEQLKDNFEVRKLNTKKMEVSSQLGMKVYLAVKNNNNELPDNLMGDKNILSLIKEIENIDKEILKLSEIKN